jgi:hypothetical protein
MGGGPLGLAGPAAARRGVRGRGGRRATVRRIIDRSIRSDAYHRSQIIVPVTLTLSLSVLAARPPPGGP